MIYVIPNEATHATVVKIVFRDGDPEEFPVQFGGREVCDEVARALPAVSTDRPGAVSATVSVVRLRPLCSACGSRHDGACEGPTP